MNIPALFKEYALENLKSIPHPSRNNFFVLNDVSSLSDLLFCFLNFEVEEPSIKRLKTNFEIDFEKIYELNRKELPSAIEGLAATFESFLKKIAFIKFPQSYWEGDSTYKGISKCTLYDLIAGKSPALDATSGLPSRDFPAPLVSNSGVSKAILDFVRSELRNAVHAAKEYTRTQLVQYSNLVLGAYLIAVHDNKQYLQKRFFPEFTFLEGIIQNKEFNKVNKNYIDLFGKEEVLDFDTIAVEQLDGQKLIASLELNLESEEEPTEIGSLEAPEVARIDSVLNISKDTDRFIIIGEPGSGKTTSLQKILYDNAKDCLTGVPGARLPVYVKASSFSSGTSMQHLVEQEVAFARFDELVEKYRLLVLIDGLNEIEDSFKRQAFSELKGLMTRYPQVCFIISSRTFGFYNDWNLKVFELKRFNETQIRALIVNITGEHKGSVLWEQVASNRQILELAHNPLMLMMIIAVSAKGGNKIPPNKGILYKLFNDAILAREKRFYTTDVETKKEVLAYLAFWMRSHGIFKKINKIRAKELIREKLQNTSHAVGANELFNELLDNNFFSDKGEDLEFYHETQQEYFVALEIKNQFYKKDHIDFNYSDPRWFEPILICSDLFTSDTDRLHFFELIFIGSKNKVPKLLDEFTSQESNPRFYVACKVAYNLKELHPSLYLTAEKYLENYLALWSYQRSRGVELIPFETILTAVASLSSEKIFQKVFGGLKYLSAWMYHPQFDNRVEEEEEGIWTKKFHERCKVFANHLNDFTLLYKGLVSNQAFHHQLHAVSRSIYYNIKLLRNYLVQNLPVNQLVQAFRQTFNKEILFQIGKSDLEFFLENYVLIKDYDEKEFFGFILRYHGRNKAGLEYLLTSLADSSTVVDTRVHVLSELLAQPVDKRPLFETLQLLVGKKDNFLLHPEVRALLNQFPLDVLQVYQLEVLYRAPAVEVKSLKAQLKSKDDSHFYYELAAQSSKDISLHVHNLTYNEQLLQCNLIGEPGIIEGQKKVLIVQGQERQITECFTHRRQKGVLHVQCSNNKKQSTVFLLRYDELFRSKSSDKLLIHMEEDRLRELQKMLDRFRWVQIKIGPCFFRIRGFGMHYIGAVLKCSRAGLPEADHLTFQLPQVKLDFSNPFVYHRDYIKEEPAALNYLKEALENKVPAAANFVAALGLCHLFPHYVNLRLGVVVSTSVAHADYLKIYLINEKRFVEGSFVRSVPGEPIVINSIVLMEINNNIAPIDNFFVPQELYVEQEVITLTDSGAEGFIKSNDGTKDYYFTAQFCDFTPKVGDRVRFIPGLNSFRRYLDKPAAYCISFVSFEQKLAEVIKVERAHRHFNVFLRDQLTGELLFSRLYDSQNVQNYKGKIYAGVVVSYYFPDKFANLTGIRRVYVRSLESLPPKKRRRDVSYPSSEKY